MGVDSSITISRRGLGSQAGRRFKHIEGIVFRGFLGHGFVRVLEGENGLLRVAQEGGGLRKNSGRVGGRKRCGLGAAPARKNEAVFAPIYKSKPFPQSLQNEADPAELLCPSCRECTATGWELGCKLFVFSWKWA
jgi:hypothetical protein